MRDCWPFKKVFVQILYAVVLTRKIRHSPSLESVKQILELASRRGRFSPSLDPTNDLLGD
jgi:hypothetical protein